MSYQANDGVVTIRRKQHNGDNPYVVLSRDCVDDPRLSWKARGLLHWMLGRPEDWNFNTKDVSNRSHKDGKDSVSSGLKELIEFGYVEVVRERNSAGQFKRTYWYVDEYPNRPITDMFV